MILNGVLSIHIAIFLAYIACFCNRDFSVEEIGNHVILNVSEGSFPLRVGKILRFAQDDKNLYSGCDKNFYSG